MRLVFTRQVQTGAAVGGGKGESVSDGTRAEGSMNDKREAQAQILDRLAELCAERAKQDAKTWPLTIAEAVAAGAAALRKAA